MSKAIEDLKKYKPYNEQEKGDVDYFILCEEKRQILTRENICCHLTASAFVLNIEHNKVLSVFHNIYKSWSLPGGHCDGVDDLKKVAQKEAEEESGLSSLKLLKNEPISVDSLTTASHFKNNKFVPAHIHLNVCYLFEGDEREKLRIKPDENSDIRWLKIDELIDFAREEQMKRVYQKIIEKLKSQNI